MEKIASFKREPDKTERNYLRMTLPSGLSFCFIFGTYYLILTLSTYDTTTVVPDLIYLIIDKIYLSGFTKKGKKIKQIIPLVNGASEESSKLISCIFLYHLYYSNIHCTKDNKQLKSNQIKSL